MKRKLLGTISEDFDAKGQLLNIYYAFIKYLRKWEYNETMHQLFIDFKKAYESVMSEDLHNFLIQFGIPMKLNYLLTPMSRVLLERLTSFQPVKKFLAFHGTWTFITTFTSACHLSLS
jgi:hypothetical protein